MERINIDEKNYVVFDIETNGLKSRKHDILSMTLYKPDDGKIFNRFFPLELNDSVYTTQFNGITEHDLLGSTSLTQDEFNRIVDEFELYKRVILIYAPRNGFDEIFLREYCKRKHIIGYRRLKFYNFKKQIISPKESKGYISKDNLCTAFGIQNVSKIHTGKNDCLIEWDLFKKMKGDYYFVTVDDRKQFYNIFRWSPQYILPVSYLSSHNGIHKLYPNLPELTCKSSPIKKIEINVTRFGRYPADFLGQLIENLFNSLLNATKIDSRFILTQNKLKMEFIGKIPIENVNMPLILKNNGEVRRVGAGFEKEEREINDFVRFLKLELREIVDFIKEEVFLGDEIKSQELVINEQDRILAKCDFSNEFAVLEIKTNDYDSHLYREQLYYEAKGRKCYHLRTSWLCDKEGRLEKLVFKIFRVEIAKT